MYITQEGNRRAVQERAAGGSGVTIQATGAISWRKEGIKYRKNELFIDVVENCNLMMSSKGSILRNDVSGAIIVKCYLSGQPECKFGLNDKLLLESEAKTKKSAVRRTGSGIEIDDVSFHQVRGVWSSFPRRVGAPPSRVPCSSPPVQIDTKSLLASPCAWSRPCSIPSPSLLLPILAIPSPPVLSLFPPPSCTVRQAWQV